MELEFEPLIKPKHLGRSPRFLCVSDCVVRQGEDLNSPQCGILERGNAPEHIDPFELETSIAVLEQLTIAFLHPRQEPASTCWNLFSLKRASAVFASTLVSSFPP